MVTVAVDDSTAEWTPRNGAVPCQLGLPGTATTGLEWGLCLIRHSKRPQVYTTEPRLGKGAHCDIVLKNCEIGDDRNKSMEDSIPQQWSLLFSKYRYVNASPVNQQNPAIAVCDISFVSDPARSCVGLLQLKCLKIFCLLAEYG